MVYNFIIILVIILMAINIGVHGKYMAPRKLWVLETLD